MITSVWYLAPLGSVGWSYVLSRESSADNVSTTSRGHRFCIGLYSGPSTSLRHKEILEHQSSSRGGLSWLWWCYGCARPFLACQWQIVWAHLLRILSFHPPMLGTVEPRYSEHWTTSQLPITVMSGWFSSSWFTIIISAFSLLNIRLKERLVVSRSISRCFVSFFFCLS